MEAEADGSGGNGGQGIQWYVNDSDIIWQAFAGLLVGLYSLLALISFFQLIRIHRAQVIKKMTIQKIFHIMICWAGFIRAALFTIPPPVWRYGIGPNYPTLQMFLDLLPELSFFFVYYLLILFWGVVFQYSRGLDSRAMLYRNIWICFFVGVIIVALAEAALVISIPNFTNFSYDTVEGIYLASLSGGLFIAVLCLMAHSWRSLRRSTYFLLEAGNTDYVGTNSTSAAVSSPRSPSFSPAAQAYQARKILRASKANAQRMPGKTESMERKVRIVGLIALICFAVHTGYLVVVDFSFASTGFFTHWGVGYRIVWTMYFILTEILPNFVLLWAIARIVEHRLSSEEALPVVHSPEPSAGHPLYLGLHLPGQAQWLQDIHPVQVGQHVPYAVVRTSRDQSHKYESNPSYTAAESEDESASSDRTAGGHASERDNISSGGNYYRYYNSERDFNSGSATRDDPDHDYTPTTPVVQHVYYNPAMPNPSPHLGPNPYSL